jgi:hypothetical protein
MRIEGVTRILARIVQGKEKKLVELELNCTLNFIFFKCNYEKQVEEKKTYLEVEHFFN